LVRPGRFLVRLIALVQCRFCHDPGVRGGCVGVARFPRARREHDLIAFHLTCRHARIIGLGGTMRLCQARILRRQIGGLID
jgi:hypothetical protein